KVSGQGEQPGLPLNSRASTVLRDLLQRLDAWPREVFMRRDPLPVPPGAAAEYLAANVSAFMGFSGAAGMVRDLLRLREAGERAIDLPPDLQYVGPCPSVFADGPRQGETCGVGLYVERGAATVKCPRCKIDSVVEDLQADALDRVDDEPKCAADMFRLLRWL